MATYDYEKVKQQYESLNDQQKQQFANMKGGYVQDFLTQYNAEKSKTSTPTTTTQTQNKTNNYGVPTEYQASGTNKANTYQNQGAGNYSYSDQSQYYEKQTTPETPKTTSMSSTQKAWDDLSYADQQKKMSEIPGLREAVTKKGWNIKSETPTTTTTPETPTTRETPKTGDGWDYQDNSPERMKQMADNVNSIYQSDPYIFNSEDSFRKFFIDGKGRTPEQEAFLMDLYKNRKKYNELDNYTADQIGYMDAHGQLPESYLTYLKNSNPERYAAVMDAKAVETDKIKDTSSLDTIGTMTGESEDTITSKAIEWLKAQGLFIDKDGNFIDDRTENYATEEEKQYAKNAADIIARNLDIDNTVKHTYDDLVEKYPGATKATLMAMAQDINSDLLREKENNNVELTRLQGYMDYMQTERQERNRIGENAISQLQKQYGMYYQYTPEGMSELAQAQYAATNVTLDQADTGTDTQKQMALDGVLTPIYEQYGDIIERPKAQVINDVIAYAKEKGITLSQALKENFTDYLKQKPAYKAMQNQMADAGWEIKNIYVDGEQQSVWYNPYTQETKPLGYSYSGSSGKYGTISMNDRGEGDYLQYRDEVQKAMRERAAQGGSLEGAAQNIAANMEGQYLGLSTCGYYVNDYIYGLTGTKGPFGSEIQSKRDACNNKNGLVGAKVGDAVVFDWTIAGGVTGVYPEYGHVGIITAKYDDGSIDVSSSISGKVQTRRIYPGDAWYQNIYGTRSLNYAPMSETNPERHPMYDRINEILYDKKSDLTKDQLSNLQNAETMYKYLYKMADDGSLQHFINSDDFQLIMKDMVNQSFSNDDGGDGFASAWARAASKANINDPIVLQVANRFQRLIELKLRKESGAAISSSEWKSNFSNLLPQAGEDAATKQDKLLGWEEGLIYPTFRYSGMPEGYVWLFDANKGLFKDIAGAQAANETPKAGTTAKGTWNISNTQSIGVGKSTSPYTTLFTQLGY